LAAADHPTIIITPSQRHVLDLDLDSMAVIIEIPSCLHIYLCVYMVIELKWSHTFALARIHHFTPRNAAPAVRCDVTPHVASSPRAARPKLSRRRKATG
jgi:hypothetical protein